MKKIRPTLRHCPVCGIAMQASKSKDHLPHNDTYQCLTCDTVIMETVRVSASQGSSEPA